MRRRKIFQLLLLFSRDDRRAFHDFLSNPFFNSSKTLTTFFEHCKRKVLDAPEENECTVEEFLEGTGINPRRLDKLCSKLYGLACDFLATQSFVNNEHARQEMLLQAIEDRDPGGREAERLYERLQGRLQDRPESPENTLQSLKLRWKLAEGAIKSRETRSLWQEDFRDLHGLLDDYYHLQKLRLLSASVNARNIYNHNLENSPDPFSGGMLAEIEKMTTTPLARAYALTIKMFQSESGAAHFQDLLQHLKAEAHHFGPSEGMELYGYALNFCIWNSNLGKLEYLEHASALYIQLLDNKLILEDGELLPTQFKNIVSLHCRLGKLEWVRTFMEDYAKFLPEDRREFALRYNRAVLSFYQAEYTFAIRRFKDVVATLPDDIFYGLDARVYLWKSYFEHFDQLNMEEVDEMFRLYDAFRLFIQRNEKIAEAHKRHYGNFIRAFKRFMEILRAEPVSGLELKSLREEVAATAFLSNKGWLLAKIDIEVKKLG